MCVCVFIALHCFHIILIAYCCLTCLSVCQGDSSSFSTPSSLFRPSSSLHKLSTSERRRGRPPGSLSIPRSSKLLKGKSKKKKKRWNVDGSDSDSDDCTGDPDWS